jgi:hypothetical protein
MSAGRLVLLAVLVALLALLALPACGGGLANAKSDYKKGRYADAKTELVALEDESQRWTGARRAEYALYRGLVHQALGDRGTAAIWLREAKAIEDAHPHTLSTDDRSRLDLALDAVGADAPPGSTAAPSP